MDPIIEVKNISKKYEITHWQGGYVALRDIMGNVIKDPVEALKYRLNSWSGKISKEEFWALKDINFRVEKGEAVGIIGANGAGKSTLLKILTRITPPTGGEIILRGKVSSLLEVGTGFHPELTGRENILLNGAILGMSQREIAQKFDAIVEFSGIEKFLDTPVKRYSSGMYVRLAFSVAAHLEPDILLVDEVLSVGDAAFQKKCLGKMDEVTKSEGRTVLFVSHNMNAIQSLCSRTILLENGRVKKVGSTKEVIEAYLGLQTDGGVNLTKLRDRKNEGDLKLTNFFIEKGKTKTSFLTTGENYALCFGYKSQKKSKLRNFSATVQINDDKGNPITMGWSRYTNQDWPTAPSTGIVRFIIKQKFPLAEGLYYVGVRISCDGASDWIKNVGMIEVRSGDFFHSGFIDKHAPFYLEQEWKLEKLT